jgi:hypothetical protein
MSATKTTGQPKPVNRLCALLMILMLILQFTPYWHYGEENAASASISSYVWFPHNNTDLNTHLKAIEPNHWVNDIVVIAVPILLLCAVGAVLCLSRSHSLLALLCPISTGLIGLIGYPCTLSLRAGAWGLHVLVCAAMLALGLYGIIAARNAAAKD